uniref:EF-hand domain-containing protein n=1 Tax=Globisporangium ultimum (strain ATCC 200006 / CBS 805.95 / DAOM BR144) TaxID=431595 RepID=K3WTK6_GLOUD
MGGVFSAQVPVPDERMLQCIVKLKLEDSDLRTLYGRFSKYDQEVTSCLWFLIVSAAGGQCGALIFSKSGTIDRSEFYKSIDEKNSEFGDAIFALIDEDNSGVLDFSEYVDALGKFCILSKEDILKFCFNVFDSDRNGTIEGTELTHLLEILHEDGQTSNMKQALASFDFNGDGKIDFDEFKQLNGLLPSLLYPAFRIQQNMRIFTMGESWWRKKIEELHVEKEKELARLQALVAGDTSEDVTKAQRDAAALAAKQKRQEQAIRMRMGCLQYHCCPCRRHRYIINETAPDSDSDDSDDDAKKNKKANSPKKAPASNDDNKKNNIVKVGPRKPLTQEERLERARKRRLRDMQDRPTRKD